jgi:Lar family restriction alleviation protein
MKKPVKVKPCPDCASDSAKIVRIRDLRLGGLQFVVECDECEYRTRQLDDRDEAIKAWNTRKNK